MTKSATILATLALVSSSFAGTAMVGGGKGKAVTPAGPAPADCPCLLTYSFAEVGVYHVDVDNVGDATGGYADVYYNIAGNFFADASYTKVGSDLESDAFGIGIGGYLPIANCVHLVGRAGYSYFEADGGDGEDALYVSPGIRAQVGCNVELYAKAYIEFADSDETVSYGAGAVYYFSKQIGLNVGYANSSDNDSWSLQAGLRYQF
jgi:hypothetical protein